MNREREFDRTGKSCHFVKRDRIVYEKEDGNVYGDYWFGEQ